MGIDLANCPPHLADAIRKAQEKQKAGKGLSHAELKRLAPQKRVLAGEVGLVWYGDPPTVTHHDKVIVNGRLIDSDALKGAIQTLMVGLPHNTGPTMLAGPLHARIHYVFRGELAGCALVPPGLSQAFWHVDKPDWDNLAKTLMDVLREKDWFQDDARVAWGEVQKSAGPTPGIGISLMSLRRDSAPATLQHLDDAGVITEYDWGKPQPEVVRGVPLTPEEQMEYARLETFEQRVQYLEERKAALAAAGRNEGL